MIECVNNSLLEKSPFCSFRCHLIFPVALHSIVLLSIILKGSWCFVATSSQDLELRFLKRIEAVYSPSRTERIFPDVQIKFTGTKVYDYVVRKQVYKANLIFKRSLIEREMNSSQFPFLEGAMLGAHRHIKLRNWVEACCVRSRPESTVLLPK
jgi:hypothetical protein